jgi:hypothetical protein
MFTNVLLVGLAAWLSMIRGAPDGSARLIARFPWVFVACLGFGETVYAIQVGQVSLVVLAGLVLALQGLRAGRDALAGAALVLATVKPQLAYLALLTLGVYVARSRRWGVLLGFGIGLAGALGVAFALSPGWLAGYRHLVAVTPFDRIYSSTIGSFAREVLGIDGLRYAGLVVLPLGVILQRVIAARGWGTALNLALLASLPLAPFGYASDQVLLVPAVAEMVHALVDGRGAARTRWIVGAALVAIEVVLFAQLVHGMPHYWYCWVPLALLATYAVGYRDFSPPASMTTDAGR